jgi:hypothetical protein
MRKRFVAAALLVCLCSAYAGPREDALAVVQKWAEAFAASDVDSIVKLYARDALFFGTGSKTLVTKPEDIRTYFEQALLSNRARRNAWRARGPNDFGDNGRCHRFRQSDRHQGRQDIQRRWSCHVCVGEARPGVVHRSRLKGLPSSPTQATRRPRRGAWRHTCQADVSSCSFLRPDLASPQRKVVDVPCP